MRGDYKENLCWPWSHTSGFLKKVVSSLYLLFTANAYKLFELSAFT